ncbi:MAG: hypothetical protein H8E10_00140 [Desulfobacterales bacterium]|nr:hypothetical protein [Desulfobacterales bacterium]MBL7212688.1 hypothetical protein [Desulfobacteraceae bacterium]
MSTKPDTAIGPESVEELLGLLREEGRKVGRTFRSVVINDDCKNVAQNRYMMLVYSGGATGGLPESYSQ